MLRQQINYETNDCNSQLIQGSYALQANRTTAIKLCALFIS